jgi:peptidoglycan hydrolase CwlO-like protein
MISRVRAVQSLPELDSYLDRVLVAASLEDMGLRG